MYKITEFQADFQNIQLSNAVSFYVILVRSKLFWLGSNWFWTSPKTTLHTEFRLLNNVQKVLIGAKQFGQVQERFGLIVGHQAFALLLSKFECLDSISIYWVLFLRLISEIEKVFFKVQKALIESMALKIPLYKIQIFWIKSLIYIQLCHKV